MHNFERRRDRYDLFASFENPLVNLSFDMALPDFRPYCKERQLPPFHFLLYCALNSLKEIDNFMYRIYEDEVIRIDDFYGSYTVINQHGDLNFARFTMSSELGEFIARSVQAKQIAETSEKLINSNGDLSPRDAKNNVNVTCMPWLRLTAIDHPIYRHHGADIPSLAWSTFSPGQNGAMTLPFSIQAHHGFVDGYHVHLLAQAIAARAERLMAA